MRSRLSTQIALLLFISCGKTEPSEPVRVDDSSIESRLYEHFVRGSGWVSYEGKFGDSLAFSSLAMGVTCRPEIYDALAGYIRDHDGALVRHDPLPDEYAGNEVSFDGETAFAWALIRRSQYCGIDVKDVWAAHSAYIKRTGGFHPSAKYRQMEPFNYTWELIDWHFGLGAKPSNESRTVAKAAALGWIYATAFRKAACYRVHLAHLHILIAEMLGEPIGVRDDFCRLTRRLEMPLADKWCGRTSGWTYQENEWEYRLQRCGAWEKPDGGYPTPGIDALMFNRAF